MYNEMTPITVYSFNPVYHFDTYMWISSLIKVLLIDFPVAVG